MGLLEDPSLAKATFFVLPWKGYRSQEELDQFIHCLNTHPKSHSQICLLALPYSLLQNKTSVLTLPHFILGCSAMANAIPGSFTEAIAAKVLRKNNARFVLIGSNDNRELREDNAHINDKIKKALDNDITPFFCMGETLQEMLAGKGSAVLKKQCQEGLKGLTLKEIAKIAFVYEAPWLQSTAELISMEKLLGHYFSYRQIVAEVVGPKVFSKIRFIDPFPNDMENFADLLSSMQGKGLYISEPSLFIPLLDALESLNDFKYPAEEMEPYSEEGLEEEPPVAEEVLKEVIAETSNEMPLEASPQSQEETLLAPKADEEPHPQEIHLVVEEKAPTQEVPTVAESVLEKALKEQISPPIEVTSHESLPDTIIEEAVTEKEETIPLSMTEEETEPSQSMPEVPAYTEEILEDNFDELSLTPETKSDAFTPLPDLPPEPSEEEVKPTEIANAEEEKPSLEEKISKMQELNQALEECYQQIDKKAKIFPQLRSAFPEKLGKMTADLNQLDPALQDEINRGNIAFFTENPEKAKEAGGVLLQLQELNFLLQETTAIPRDIDRLFSKGKELRKQLEEVWAYFSKHRHEIKENHPDFEYPLMPSQLSAKEPVVDLNPRSAGPSPLIGKRMAVVKAPPIKNY